MNTLLSRTLGNAPRILFHSLTGIGLMWSINSPLYAQTAIPPLTATPLPWNAV